MCAHTGACACDPLPQSLVHQCGLMEGNKILPSAAHSLWDMSCKLPSVWTSSICSLFLCCSYWSPFIEKFLMYLKENPKALACASLDHGFTTCLSWLVMTLPHQSTEVYLSELRLLVWVDELHLVCCVICMHAVLFRAHLWSTRHINLHFTISYGFA